MISVIALALAAAALLFAVYAYFELRASSKSLMSLARAIFDLEDQHNLLVFEYDKQIEVLMRDIDLLHSQGQVKSIVSRVPSAPGIDIDGQLTDGLPLQGGIVIVGQSGSGKSNLVMTQIMRRIRGGQEVHCIDTKGEIKPIFGKYVDCVKPEDAAAKFSELLTIAKERQQLFDDTTAEYQEPCRDFGEYFELTGNKLPTIALIVEELIVLMEMVDEAKLIEMLVIGRSAGVFVVALAQYMKADILSRKGLVNFQTRVFLGQYDNIACGLIFNLDKQSRTIIEDFVGAPGKAAIQEGGKITTRTMPQVMKQHLIPFIKGEI